MIGMPPVRQVVVMTNVKAPEPVLRAHDYAPKCKDCGSYLSNDPRHQHSRMDCLRVFRIYHEQAVLHWEKYHGGDSVLEARWLAEAAEWQAKIEELFKRAI